MSTLRNAMEQFMQNWKEDLSPDWRNLLADVEPDFEKINAGLKMDPDKPIYPIRRGQHLTGVPAGSHLFKAFDRMNPDDVRVIMIGQDPYPSRSHATGLAFEQGNIKDWVSIKVAPSLQKAFRFIAEIRTGESAYVQNGGWQLLKEDLRSGKVHLSSPDAIFNEWSDQGVLWLNTAFTITKAQDVHQMQGHIPMWRPIIQRIVTRLAQRDQAKLVIVAWGGKAKDFLVACGMLEKVKEDNKTVYRKPDHLERVEVVQRHHPAVDKFLKQPNSFVEVNEKLCGLKVEPINW